MKKILLIISIFLTSCGEQAREANNTQGVEDDNKFTEYSCRILNDAPASCTCIGDVTVKVRRRDNTVYLIEKNPGGDVSGNQFLSDCQIFDRKNWKCKELEMADGKLIDQPGGPVFYKYEQKLKGRIISDLPENLIKDETTGAIRKKRMGEC